MEPGAGLNIPNGTTRVVDGARVVIVTRDGIGGMSAPRGREARVVGTEIPVVVAIRFGYDSVSLAECFDSDE